jgi:hypothetical protein
MWIAMALVSGLALLAGGVSGEAKRGSSAGERKARSVCFGAMVTKTEPQQDVSLQQRRVAANGPARHGSRPQLGASASRASLSEQGRSAGMPVSSTVLMGVEMDSSFEAQPHHGLDATRSQPLNGRRRRATTTENLRLRYAGTTAADETRRNVQDVEVKLPGPFLFEGREWIATSVAEDGFTLCVEHERTFVVRVEGAVYAHKGPLPAVGELITLENGLRIRVRDVALAHHDSQRGSFHADRI